MATLDDTIAQARAAIVAAAPGIAETQAQTVLALVTYRIQNEGLAGAHYTGKLVARSLFAKSAFNAGGRAYAGKKGKGTYAGFKQALGVSADYVNLTLTGRMFRSLTTLAGGVSGTVYRASIVAADQESADKVKWNAGRYGDFLQPEPDEAAEVQAVGQQAVDRIMQQFFQ